MNMFSDNHATTLATRRCYGLVNLVQRGMEKKGTGGKSKVKFTLEQAIMAQ